MLASGTFLFPPAQPVDQESFRLHVIVVDGEVLARDEDRGQLEQRHAVPRRGERLVGSPQRGVMRGADTETLALLRGALTTRDSQDD